MKEERYQLVIDRYERSLLVSALNDKRNQCIAEECSTDAIDDLILKIADAPVKRMFRNAER